MRAAASSIASGSPSSRVQTPATASSSASSGSKPCTAARARSTKSCTADEPSSGGTGYTCSPETLTGVRLVTTTRRPAAALTRSASSGPVATSCSKLSTTSSVGRSRNRSTSAAFGERPPETFTASACAIAGTTSAGSVTAASETNATEPSNAGASRRASAIASRVFPIPPGPVSVTMRSPSPRMSAATSSSSRSRPTSDVSGSGSGSVVSSCSGCAASDGSCSRIARSRSRSSVPGSIPSSSTSVRRASRYTASASAWRPLW